VLDRDGQKEITQTMPMTFLFGLRRAGTLAFCLSLASAACSSDGNPSGAGGSAGDSSAGESNAAGSSAAGAGVGGAASQAGQSSTGGAGAGAGAAAGAPAGNAGSTGVAGAIDTGPAPSPKWVNATGNLANMPSECGNLTLLSTVPDSDTVIAGVAKGGLFASDNGGATWKPLGTGSGSALITNRPSSIVYDPEHAGTFWESGIYNDGGVYKTSDGGKTFARLGDITHNDLVSVDFSDPERNTLLVGGHEQKQMLYLSTDGGKTFTQIGKNLPSDAHFSVAPLVLDKKTFLLGSCGYGDGACGVYRSTDSGQHWQRASDLSAAARPLWASDGSIYWSLIYNSGIARGTSDGTSWSKTADGITTAYPVELPDGRVLTVSGDHVVVSADRGSTWKPVGEKLPFEASGVVYSVRKKMLFVWQWDCGDVVLPDAIASAGFDYTQK